MRVRCLMDGCCCNGITELRLEIAAVVMIAQGRQTSVRAPSQCYVLEAMESHPPIIIIERERKSSRYYRAYGNSMSSTLGLCITRSTVIAKCKGLLAFIMDTH